MTLIAADRLSKRFNEQVILDRVSFTIVAGERIGLVGRNGSGKTTLFELIAGLQEVDSGTVTRPKGCYVDYIEQEKSDYHDLTLFEYVASAREDLLQIRRDITRLEAVLAENPEDRNSLTRLGSIQSRFEHEGGFTFENEIKTILTGLSFGEERYHDRMINFSGGEKNRAGLARALAGKGNLLLLDEPTNHLDIDSTLWLEDYLNKTNKSFLVVSHDRTFLGNTVDKVWEITRGKIDVYHGTFEKYLSERAERIRLHEHHYRHQQDEIKRIEDFIRRNM
ncbi:MAG: ABC-F family ATP-binding cassette domain-containing protein, partial [candidate division Zixibacteria bacterium]|nr:ABC-F family ATP-binding cassette domain-containing protein [candidate division Zixibacteria bacterium]